MGLYDYHVLAYGTKVLINPERSEFVAELILIFMPSGLGCGSFCPSKNVYYYNSIIKFCPVWNYIIFLYM